MDEKDLKPGDREAAERWFARLKAPDCTAAERMEFQRWRTAPAHAEAYAATQKIWRKVGELEGRPDLENLSERVLAYTAPAPRRFFALAASVGAVAVAVLLGVAWRMATEDRSKPAVVYTTQQGERRTLTLSDGSEVTLNYSTQVDVRFRKDARLVTVRGGEALFTVAHEKARPFRVSAGDGQVTALGTRFDVRSDAQGVAVTLLEGRIALDRAHQGEHLELEPGDRVQFAVAGQRLKRLRVDPGIAGSWSTGRLRFRATPLAEVLEEVNRYSRTRIRLADPSLGRLPISGTFAVGDTASVVDALKALLPVEAVEREDGETLLQPR